MRCASVRDVCCALATRLRRWHPQTAQPLDLLRPPALPDQFPAARPGCCRCSRGHAPVVTRSHAGGCAQRVRRQGALVVHVQRAGRLHLLRLLHGRLPARPRAGPAHGRARAEAHAHRARRRLPAHKEHARCGLLCCLARRTGEGGGVVGLGRVLLCSPRTPLPPCSSRACPVRRWDCVSEQGDVRARPLAAHARCGLCTMSGLAAGRAQAVSLLACVLARR